jgi:hypothetical protein
MKVKKLIEALQEFNQDSEIVIQTQKKHALFGDIGQIEESEEDCRVLVMQFQNEGYSPNQALNR